MEYHRVMIKKNQAALKSGAGGSRARAAVPSQVLRPGDAEEDHVTSRVVDMGVLADEGRGMTKLVHRWQGPAWILEAAGYDNFFIELSESQKRSIVHSSFIISYYHPEHQRDEVAQDLLVMLEEKELSGTDIDYIPQPQREPEPEPTALKA